MILINYSYVTMVTSQYESLQCETTNKYFPHLQIRHVLLVCYITSLVTMNIFVV